LAKKTKPKTRFNWYVMVDDKGDLHYAEDPGNRTPKTIKGMKVIGSFWFKNPQDAIDFVAGGGFFG
jgi:hypothetical protein